MSKPPILFSPRWWRIVRLILREWRRGRRVAKQRQNSGSLNEAATAAYRDAHDAQLARTPAPYRPPTGPAAGDFLASIMHRHKVGNRFSGDLHDPWAPDTWIDA